MSVRRCQHEVDAQEFAGWVVYDSLEPIGQVSDIQMADIAATLTNMQIARGRRATRKDFLPSIRYSDAEGMPVQEVWMPKSPDEEASYLDRMLGFN